MTMIKTFVTNVFGDKGRFVQWFIKPALGLVLLAVIARHPEAVEDALRKVS